MGLLNYLGLTGGGSTPINTNLSPPFSGMSIQQVCELVDKEKQTTQDIIERCRLGERMIELKISQYKALTTYKKNEHDALVKIGTMIDSVQESATKNQRKYRKLKNKIALRSMWG